MWRRGTRAPRIPQLGEDWLVRASGRGAASKPVVTARLDHRCCKKLRDSSRPPAPSAYASSLSVGGRAGGADPRQKSEHLA